MVGTMRAKRVILDLGRKILNSDDLFTVSVAKESNHWVGGNWGRGSRYMNIDKMGCCLY